jgi:hypothetical protein
MLVTPRPKAKPTELWFGSNEEYGDVDPMAAYGRLSSWMDDDELGPWTLERYGVRPTVDHLPSAEQILEWVESIDEADDFRSSTTVVMEQIDQWSSEHGEIDEWWCDQLMDVSPEVAEDLVASPTLETAEALRQAVADEITYVMAGEHLSTHQLTRTTDGRVLLDGEVIGEWTPIPPPCCRACVGTPLTELGQRSVHPRCPTCGDVFCPRATSHLNRCPSTDGHGCAPGGYKVGER